MTHAPKDEALHQAEVKDIDHAVAVEVGRCGIREVADLVEPFSQHHDVEHGAGAVRIHVTDERRGRSVRAAPGRRSRKREKVFLSSLREEADALADAFGVAVFWDRPLGPDRGTP